MNEIDRIRQGCVPRASPRTLPIAPCTSPPTKRAGSRVPTLQSTLARPLTDFDEGSLLVKRSVQPYLFGPFEGITVSSRNLPCTVSVRRLMFQIALRARGCQHPGLMHSPLVAPVYVPRESRQIRIDGGIIDAAGVQHDLDVPALLFSWNRPHRDPAAAAEILRRVRMHRE
jgi:hypothetical protein